MKKLYCLAAFVMLVCIGTMYASVEINGIAYILHETDRTADVTSKSPLYSGDVIIPSSVTYNGINYNVTSIGGYLSHAFQNCTGLTSVTIGSRVTSIGDGAFRGCTGLSTIQIPDNVQQLGWSTFSGCTGLTSVTIGSGVKTLGGTFINCTGLTSITIPNTVDTIIDPFRGCANLTAIHISDLSHWCSTVFYSSTTGGYKYYNSIFSQNIHLFVNDTEIIDLVIPDGVTNIADGAFYGSVISSVTIPNSVTNIGNYAFTECTGLTSVTIPNSVTSIEEMAFSGCTSLSSVDIPNGVTSIGRDAFRGCSSLTSVTIPNSITSIGDYALFNCSSLTSVTIPNSVTSIGDMAFYNIPNIIYQGTAEGAPWGARSVNGYVDGWLIYKDDTKTELLACLPEATGEITIPNSVTTVGNNAFCGCEGITNIVIPQSVTDISGSAFSGCTGLPVINNIRYADSYLVEAVDKTLTTYTLKNGIKWIGEDAFSGCTNMTSFAIPDGIKRIEYGTFWNCSSLNTVTIPNSVTSIEEMAFSGCTSLSSVDIPNGVTSIGFYAFSNCLGLTSIVIPASVDTIEEQAFARCKNLTTVTINSNAVAGADYPVPAPGYGYTSGLINIFGTQVEQYIFGEGVTRIGNNAFYSNYSKSVTTILLGKLSSITFPSTLTSIGEQAFYHCPLPFLYIPETVTSIGNDAFKDMQMIAYRGEATGAPWGATCYNEWCGNSSLPVTTWVDIADNSIAEWNELPAEYVYELISPDGGSFFGLQSVKVFADSSYINLLVTPNMGVLEDLEWVPFHIFIDADNSDATGGSSYPFTDANADLLLEGAIFSEGEPYSYSPAVYPWYGEVGGEDWNWSNDEMECFGALVCEGALQDCGSQYVDGKFEIKINRNNIPFNWNKNTFGIGFGILQNWSYVGILPAVSYTNQNPDGYTNKLKVQIYNNYHLYKEVIDSIAYLLNDRKLTAQVDVTHGDTVIIPPYVVYENQKYTVTGILEKAFFGNIDLTSVTIPATVSTIGKNAFAYCMGLRSITCEASVPPVLDKNVFTGTDQTTCVLYVPQSSIDLYAAAEQWNEFLVILPIAAQEATVTEIEASVNGNEVIISWPSIDEADYYIVEIKQGDEVISTLTFDAQGILLSTAYNIASRDSNNRPSHHATQTGSGWQYSIYGLEADTQYSYSIRAIQGEEEVFSQSIVFSTPSVYTTIETIETQTEVYKILRNGQILILRGEKTYTITGQQVR